jgi:hypothetical protein
MTATRMLMGRRRAARISHIGQRTPADGFTKPRKGVNVP